jgi:hypothetical protein
MFSHHTLVAGHRPFVIRLILSSRLSSGKRVSDVQVKQQYSSKTEGERTEIDEFPLKMDTIHFSDANREVGFEVE